MQTDHPHLFENNPEVDLVVPYRRTLRRWVRMMGGRTVYPDYAPYDRRADRSTPPEEHVIAAMARKVGLSGTITLRPHVYLTKEERESGFLADGQVVVHSTGLGARMPMLNKEWGVSRFQEVVLSLRREHPLVQVGLPEDPLLEGVLDRRGATVRETAAILSRAACFVGLVGFLMHLARAVDCRSVIVYGGREAPWQSGYVANENLYSAIPCAPCWLWNRCEHQRACLAAIAPEAVVDAVERQLHRTGDPLPEETVVI
jgi:hypothetical protein